VSTKNLPFQDYSSKPLELNMTINSIEYVDSRDSISTDEDIDLPFMSKPKQRIEFYPKLSEMHRSIIENTIYENTLNDSINVFKLQVEIIEASKIFSATWTTEKEEVFIKLKITASNNFNKYWSIAEGNFILSSVDAKNNRFKELYNYSIKNVTYKALDYLSEYLKDNNSEHAGRVRISYKPKPHFIPCWCFHQHTFYCLSYPC